MKEDLRYVELDGPATVAEETDAATNPEAPHLVTNITFLDPGMNPNGVTLCVLHQLPPARVSRTVFNGATVPLVNVLVEFDESQFTFYKEKGLAVGNWADAEASDGDPDMNSAGKPPRKNPPVAPAATLAASTQTLQADDGQYIHLIGPAEITIGDDGKLIVTLLDKANNAIKQGISFGAKITLRHMHLMVEFSKESLINFNDTFMVALHPFVEVLGLDPRTGSIQVAGAAGESKFDGGGMNSQPPPPPVVNGQYIHLIGPAEISIGDGSKLIVTLLAEDSNTVVGQSMDFGKAIKLRNMHLMAEFKDDTLKDFNDTFSVAPHPFVEFRGVDTATGQIQIAGLASESKFDDILMNSHGKP